MSNFGLFYHAHSPNIVMPLDPRCKYRIFKVYLHFTFNIRKVTNFLVETFSALEVISQQPKTCLENASLPLTPPPSPSAFRANNELDYVDQ